MVSRTCLRHFQRSTASRRISNVMEAIKHYPNTQENPPKSIDNDIRPISLTSTLSKIFESYVGQWVLEAVRCTVSSKIANRQFGGLKGKSTTHELVDLLHHCYEALDKSQHIRVLFVDYSKAFDHLDHSKLIEKLVKLEVPGCLINWLRSFLTQRRQRVMVKNAVSGWLSAHGGMPQGSWLAPLVFILFINDLSPSCLSYKYIDDLKLSEFLHEDDESKMSVLFNHVIQ